MGIDGVIFTIFAALKIPGLIGFDSG